MGAIFSEDDVDCSQQNDEVVPDRPVPDVPTIHGDTSLEGSPAAATDLPKPRDTGFDVGVDVDGLTIVLKFAWEQRTGTYQAHVAQDHVDELRQFINTRAAYPSAKWGHPGIFS